MLEKEKTITISGHRPRKLPWGYDEAMGCCVKFKKKLKIVFEKAIAEGFECFLSGMAEGVDMIAAQLLMEIKEIQTHIKIIAVVPCRNQCSKWAKQQQEKYKQMLENCDKVIVLNEKYTPTCMNERNKFMCENSCVLIAGFSGERGGTKNTIEYAKQNKSKVIIINPYDCMD